MHIHILGIAGTFMAGLAVLGRELNFKVSGCDQNIYPPMSTQLDSLGIQFFDGFSDEQLENHADCLIVGNVMRRGMPVIETLLNRGLPMLSGPEFLAKYVLQNKHVLAVSGTHGKTTTTSMLAWILEYAGLKPGFLIGGIPQNFDSSARLGGGKYFVLEADEYDSAFFDKRSKFLHYRPKTLIINNLEFDHADIFPNLEAIKTQFHHLIRTVPNQGLIIYPENDKEIIDVLERGCWSKTSAIGISECAKFYGKSINAEGSSFEVYCENEKQGIVEWSLIGQHNILNAVVAISAANHVGVKPSIAISALSCFKGVKRRLELKGTEASVTVFDDFAHHPTAIKTTLQGLRAQVKTKRIIAVVDLRSNMMKAGHHQHELPSSFTDADHIYLYKSKEIAWDVEKMWRLAQKPGGVFSDLNLLMNTLKNTVTQEDQVIFMSNGGFSNIQNEFLNILKDKISVS